MDLLYQGPNRVFFFCNWELPHLMAINLIKTRFLFCFKHEGLACFCFVFNVLSSKYNNRIGVSWVNAKYKGNTSTKK